MTVQEVQERIRAYIVERLEEALPEQAYQDLWQMYEQNLQELAQEDPEDVDWELVMHGYLMAADAIWKTKQGALGVHGISPANGSHCRLHAQMLGRIVEGEASEVWWEVLPERDKQALQNVWDMVYNAYTDFAELFRNRFLGGRTLTPEEAFEWVKSRESGCLEVVEVPPDITSPYIYHEYESFLQWVHHILFLFGNTERAVCVSMYEDDSPVEVLAFSRLEFYHGEIYKHLASILGVHESILLKARPRLSSLIGEFVPDRCISYFIVTGTRLPARIVEYVATQVKGGGMVLHPMPLYPPFLSSEGLARVWQTMKWGRGAKISCLGELDWSSFSTFREACDYWNRVAPAEWRFTSYRAMYVEWQRLWGKAPQEMQQLHKPCKDTVKPEQL